MSAEVHVVRDKFGYSSIAHTSDHTSTVLNQTSVEPMPYLTQQYALAIHHSNLHKDNSDASEDSGEQTPRAETMLRRKTPNGTLNAGYEASALNMQPQKHQLVQAHDLNAMQGPLDRSKKTFLQHEQRQRSVSHGWQSYDNGAGWHSGPLPRQSTWLPVMDSMLHQIPMQQYGVQHYYGLTVPSVLQPSMQYLGPTASGGQGSGPYGPYWHDGTFVPYRPTVVRDPRFYHHPSAAWPGSLPASQFPHTGHVWQPSVHPPTYWTPTQATRSIAGLSAGFAPLHASVEMSHNSNLYAGLANTDARHHIWDPASDSAIESGTATPRAVPTAHEGSSTSAVDSEFGSSSPNGRQRDKTFAWALQQYKELLNSIHHSRRQQQPARHPHVHMPQRSSFYPKPPWPSMSGAASQVNNKRTNASGVSETTSSIRRDSATPVHGYFNSATGSDETNSTPYGRSSSSTRTPGGGKTPQQCYERSVSYEQQRRSQEQSPYPLHHPEDKFRTLRRHSSSSISPIISPLPQDDTPQSRATLALLYMTKLCQETNWQWTDGMHLGGCLAYGLGDYHKARRWYNKVLEIDPKHLEATSNLAAALLALGMRREAERHWMTVMTAAPNHFEAVEHLVGLLCYEHRSRDAIKVIEYVERTLRQHKISDVLRVPDQQSECSSSTASRSPAVSDMSDRIAYDFEGESEDSAPDWRDMPGASEPGFGSSGFAIPGADSGRILALIHAKGNMLYGLGDNGGAAHAFQEAVLIAVGRKFSAIQGLIRHILKTVASTLHGPSHYAPSESSSDPVLLAPDQALAIAKLCFPHFGELPGLHYVQGGPQSLARRAAISTTSNSLLSLAKIFQDGMSNSHRAAGVTPLASGVRDILALYYLSLSLQPSPSTANNVGILLASVQQIAPTAQPHQKMDIPGVIPGSGIALALQYYNYGLQLDQNHAHLYTNLGSLLKDIGQLDAAISMYERAVKCDGRFDIALANLANAVKDKGRISDAIVYYKRAVEVSPDFAEAVCGLANALNSVCGWQGRGGIAEDGGRRDRWHVDVEGMLLDAKQPGATSSGWIKRVVDIVQKQLLDGKRYGCGTVSGSILQEMVQQLVASEGLSEDAQERQQNLRKTLEDWAGRDWEGARVTRLVERATRRIGWQWYRDAYIRRKQRPPASYNRPQLPASLAVPSAPTVLPFHTFTCPMSAKQIRLISQRNALRISVSTLRSPWLPKQVYPPPRPPTPVLHVGYVSSDFNNHPLAHLMQSVFGMHNGKRVKAYCYATTASDNSEHRRQIESEAPGFHDASSWSAEKLVNQVVKDGIHILVNLNGYTRGARNEVFAARPAPIQMSFMGFAGTLGAEWCDYLLADETSIPPETLRPWRRNVDLEDQLVDENNGSNDSNWVYSENIIYCRDTFFCCDHRQSPPDAQGKLLSWEEEQRRRWQMRKELFPQLADNTIIFGNFNQLYKIEPTTFRTWLRILARVPNSVLWLLRFPDLGESHLSTTAHQWAGPDVASRVLFTDVAPKHLHISRARICDLVLDTPECNAHTTAADVLWSGTPLLTLPRYAYKMCSRMAASILKGALPKSSEGTQAAQELIASHEEDYEDKAVALGKGLKYVVGSEGIGRGRLVELRKMLYHSRWTSALFDTKRWVRDLEDGYDEAWRRWVVGEGGDIWLSQVARKS